MSDTGSSFAVAGFGLVWSARRAKRALRRAWPFVALVWIALAVGFVAWMRYATPRYLSEAEMRMDAQDNARVLSLKDILAYAQDQTKDLHFEVFSAHFFLQQLRARLPDSVRYFQKGRVRDSEVYPSPPFRCAPLSAKDKPLFITLVNATHYRWAWALKGPWHEAPFGQPTSAGFCVRPTPQLKAQHYQKTYYCYLQSPAAWRVSIQAGLQVKLTHKKANTMALSFEDPHPRRAQDILLHACDLYKAALKTNKEKPIRVGLAFVEAQLKDVKDAMERYEAYFNRILIHQKTFDTRGDIRRLLVENKERHQSLVTIQQQIKALDALKLAAQKDGIIAVNPVVMKQWPPFITESVERYNAIFHDKKNSELSYKTGSYILRLHANKQALLRQELIEFVEIYRSYIATHYVDADEAKQTTDQRIRELAGLSVKYERIKRLHQLNEQFYMLLIRKKIELEIARAGLNTQITLLRSASLPPRPMAPNKGLLGAVMTATAAVFSLMIAALFYVGDNRIHDLQTLREQIPAYAVLGSLPHLPHSASKGTHGLTDTALQTRLIPHLKPCAGALRYYALRHTKQTTLLITSPNKSAGKTFIALNLAKLWGEQNQKVLWMDLGHDPMHRTNEQETIKQPEQLIKRFQTHAFDALRFAFKPIDALEYVAANRFQTLMTWCRNHYRIILWDMHNVAQDPAAHALLLKQADYVLCVVHARNTPLSMVQKWDTELLGAELRPRAALMLNAVKQHSP